MAALDPSLLRDLDSSSGPGYVYAAAVHGETVLDGACGLADVTLGLANTPATRMRIGSTSKEMTAWVVLGLAEDGLLQLDRPLRHYLPELAPNPVEPTVLQVLQHTGGVRCHVADAFLQDLGHAVRPHGAAQAALLRQRGLNSEPGTRWIYSNGGYHLLSRAAERVTGLEFPRLMAERLFRPLGMAHTAVVPSDLRADTAGLATLHLPAGAGRWRRGLFPFEDLLGEGGVVSTARDMLKWLRALRQPAGAREARLQARMMQATRLADGTTVPYGCGLLHLRRFGLDVYMHAGAVMGGSAQAFCVPSHGIDIAVMGNGAGVAPGEVAGRILKALLPEAAAATDDEVQRPRSAEHASLVGRVYQAPSGNVVEFAEVAGLLAVSVFGNPAVPLRRVGDELVLAFEEAALGPLRLRHAPTGAAEAPQALRIAEGALEETYTLQDPGSAAGIGPALEGAYACDELETQAEIRCDAQGPLMAIRSPWGGMQARLKPLSATALQWQADDPFMPAVGVFSVRRDAGRVQGLQLDAWTSRRLFYRRLP